jgi:predicted metal-binding protein
MQPVKLLPEAHLFVCANRREADSPLGPGCAERGDALYEALKAEVARRGLVRPVWVTKTHCLGICPKHGATVAAYLGLVPGGAARQAIWAGAVAADAATLLQRARGEP